jgi:hypothetical protein
MRNGDGIREYASQCKRQTIERRDQKQHVTDDADDERGKMFHGKSPSSSTGVELLPLERTILMGRPRNVHRGVHIIISMAHLEREYSKKDRQDRHVPEAILEVSQLRDMNAAA